MAKKSATKAGADAHDHKRELPEELTKALEIGGADAAQTVDRLHQALHMIYDGNAASYGRRWLDNLKNAPDIAAEIKNDTPKFEPGKKGKQSDFSRGFFSALSIIGSMTGTAMQAQSKAILGAVDDPKLPLDTDKSQALMSAFSTTVSLAALTHAVLLTSGKLYGADKNDDMAERIGLGLEMLDQAVHNTAMPIAEKLAEIKAADEKKTVH